MPGHTKSLLSLWPGQLHSHKSEFLCPMVYMKVWMPVDTETLTWGWVS